MNRRGSSQRETLAQRIANTRANNTRAINTEPPAPEPSDPIAPPPIRHCWYDGPRGRQAALLIEWRKRADAWHARIDVALPHPHDGGWCMTELWVEAAMVAPVQG